MAVNRKIKICHLSSVHRATDTRIFYKECRSLAKVYNTILIAPAEKDEIVDDVQILAVKYPANRLYRFLITDWVIFFKCIKTRASLCHIHDPELIIQGLLLRLLGKKVILDIEEEVRADIEEKKWLPSKALFKFLYLFFEKFAVKYFYLILAEDSYSEIYRNRTSNFIVIQNFVPLAELGSSEYAPVPGENTLALVGALGARRSLPYILDALYILQQKGILVNLKCVGARDKAVEDILTASVSWPFVKNQIDFKGYIPFPVCLYECRSCFAGLALPETLPNHIRSYPTKMFEYMAVGLPVISSDFQLYKDVVEKYDCGITVNPEDSMAIANAIESLVNHPDKASLYSANAKVAVQNFDWKTEEEKLLGFYETIINKKI